MPLTVAQLVARLTADTSGFYRGMAIANSAMLRSGGIISRVTTGAGLAIGAMGLLSVRAAGNFEQSMNVLQAVTGGTEQQMGKLQARAIALGKDFKLPAVSAKDAADTMLELSKAGLSVNQVMTAARGSLQLATAAHVSFSDAATFTGRALKAFHLEGSQATVVANTLAAAANKSTADFTDLTYGFQNAASQFHGVNYSVQDLSASLAELADNGLNGEIAGTALKTMIMRLTSPTNKAAAEMKDLGINVFNAHGQMKPMAAVIGEFQNGLRGLTQQQKEQALTTIFGARANQAMRILVANGAKDWIGYRNAVTGTTAAQDIAEARTKGFNGALQAIGSAVETAAIQFGLKLLPGLTKAGFAIADFIAGINVDAIFNFAASIARVVESVAKFIGAHPALQAAILGIIAGFAAFTIITSIIGMIEGMIAAFTALTAVMAANPFVLIAAALIGLGVALVYAYKHSEEFRNIVNAAFAAVKSAAAWIVDAAHTVISAIESILSAVQPEIQLIKTLITEAWNFVRTVTQQVWNVIKTIVQAALGVVKAIIEADLNVIKAIIQTVMAAIRGDWQGVWNGLKAIVSAVLQGIVSIVSSILHGLASVARALAEAIGKSIWQGIKSGAAAIAALGAYLISVIGGAISSAASWALSAAAGIGRAIGEGVISGIKGMAGAIAGAVTGAVSGAIHAAGSILHGSGEFMFTKEAVGKPLARGIIEGIILGLVDLPEKLSNKIKSALEAARTVAQAGLDRMKSQFDQFTNDVLSAFDKITQTHLTPTEGMLAEVEKQRQVKALQDAIAEATDKASAAQEKLNAARNAQPDPALERELNTLIRERDDAMSDLATKQQKLAELEKDGIGESDTRWQSAAAAVREATEKVDDYNQKITDQKGKIEDDVSNRAQAITDAEAELKSALDSLHEAEYNSWKYYAELQAAEERKQYDARREQQKRHLQDRLNDLETSLAQHPEKWKQINQQIIALLNAYGVDYKAAGIALGTAFASGLIATKNAIANAAKEIAQVIERYLKTHSPAKEGPLSDLHHWWDGFVPTLVSGLNQGALEDALSSFASPLSSNTGLGTMGGATSTGGTTNVYVNIEGSLVREREASEMVYDHISEAGRYRTTLWGGK